MAEVKTDDIDEFVDALVYIEEPIVFEVERVEVVKLGMLVPALADLIRQLGERELREIERPGFLGVQHHLKVPEVRQAPSVPI